MTVKEEVKEMLEKLPDNATFDEVHYRLLVREKIDRGVADLEAGRVHSEEEMEATIKKWLEE
jgi:predicted transcriptional regulator